MPGHTDLKGNEKADINAKMAARGIESVEVQVPKSVSEVGASLKKTSWQKWTDQIRKTSETKEWDDKNIPQKDLSIPGHGHQKCLLHRLRVGAWRGRWVKPAVKCGCGKPLSIPHVLLECQPDPHKSQIIEETLKTLGLPFTTTNILNPNSTTGWHLAILATETIFSSPIGHWF